MSNQYYLATKGVQKSVEALINILKNVNDGKTNTKAPTISDKIPFADKLQAAADSAQDMANNVADKSIFNARLAPDMFPLSKQVTVVSDNLKGMVSRFTETENPKMEDNETTLDDLIARLQKTVDFANSMTEDKYDNAGNIKAVLPWMPGKYLSADDYLFQFAIPNVYFHFSIAYSILRTNGYELGKQDFIGGLNLHDLV
jgi:uncharacterized protein